MAIEYVSHSFNFDTVQSCLILTLQLQCENTSDTAEYYSITFDNRTISVKIPESAKESNVTANAKQTTIITVTYKDYTAAPAELLAYILKMPDTDPRTLTWIFTHDDLLLSTDTQVLNIKYNPDISSMKITTGDAITQTLGSQYPYFRRNGIMNYKQFNIGGLISYHEDSAFWSAPNLTGYGLSDVDIERVKEKQFRDAVLDFLYDSKPKILKSTTEGCMIVKLTGISLTPNKQLGRSIYSFTAQATEYCDPSIENLVEYGKAFEGEVITG